jgi:phage shock protein A
VKFIKRITRITTGRIESFLSEVDEPEKVLPQLAREMEQAVRSAASAEAKSLAALKSAQRKFDEVTGRSLRLERGAQLAVQQGDDALARDALAAQIQVEKDAATAKKELEASEFVFR